MGVFFYSSDRVEDPPYPFDRDRRTPYDSAVNSLTAYALAHELHRSLKGTTIEKISRYPGGYTVMLDNAAVPFLHLLHFGRDPELVPSDRPVVAEAHATRVNSALVKARIRKISPLGMDRIILCTLSTPGDWRRDEPSLARLDMTPAGAPISVFRDVEGPLLEWHGPPRAARPAAATETPPQKPLSLLSLPESPPDGLMAAVERRWPAETPEHTRHWGVVKHTARVLLGSVGGLDPLLAAVLSRTFAGELTRIWPHLAAIGAAAREGRYSWRRYEFPGEGPAGCCAVYPVALPVEDRAIELSSGLAAVRQRMDEVILPAYVRYLRTSALSAVRRSLKKSRRLAEHLAEDLREANRAREYRQYGNLLVTNRHRMKRGMSEIAVREHSGRGTVTIPLSPRLGPDENIRRYFTKAKKGEKGTLIISRRKRDIEREIVEKRALAERIATLEKPDRLLPFVPRPIARSRRAARDGAPPFKRFVIDDRHTVFVGRKDRENDELTHRFASPRDVWFHAQGVPGSHVILRGANRSTPKRVLEQAAAIAAYFSKARRSAMVPVVYAEKRYVSRPRGSPPGTAVCRRGTTLYVTPALPEKGAERHDTDT